MRMLKEFALLVCLFSLNIIHYTDAFEPVTVGTAIAVAAAIDVGTTLLKNLNDYYFEDEAKACYWNEWRERDNRARIERTYNQGRFSYDKKTFFFNNGKWYCAYKQVAAIIEKFQLDPVDKPYCKSKQRTKRQVSFAGVPIPIYPAVKSAVTIGMMTITGADSQMETDAIKCWYNDWQKRDNFAKEQKTWDHGRMSMTKKKFGVKLGKWFCAWKMPAVIDLGHPLDGQTCVQRFCALYANVCGNEKAIPDRSQLPHTR